MKSHLTHLFCILLLISICGCDTDTASKINAPDKSSAGATNTDPSDHGVDGHSHEDPPHDGTVVDWGGGKYHLEFVADHDKQEATVYILDFDVKTNLPIAVDEIKLAIKDPALQLTLQASPQEGDPEGKTSRFVGKHESLGIIKEYEGTIFGTVDNKPYSGEFKEVPHAHDD